MKQASYQAGETSEISSPTPTQPHERNITLDVIRGLAILGIFSVNMSFFSSPVVYLKAAGIEWWTQPWDRTVSWLIEFFAQGKFYTMFSFLFGLGMVMFMERTERKGHRAVSLYARRLFILLIFGVIHAFLIWSGDILMTYAFLGFALILFRKMSPNQLLKSAAVIFLIPIVLYGVLLLGAAAPEKTPDSRELEARENNGFRQEMVRAVNQSVAAYGEGTYLDMVNQRIYDRSILFAYSIFSLPHVFTMFLLGVYAARRKIIAHAEQHLGLIKKVWVYSLIIGLFGGAIYEIGKVDIGFTSGTLYEFVAQTARMVHEPALSLCYVASVILLMQREVWQKRLRPLAAVGRLAISNYLFQSLLATTIFYNYGLSLYGEVGPAAGLGLTIAVFIFQVIVSQYWIRHYHYGPVEWLWRSLTYGKKQPLRRFPVKRAKISHTSP